MDTAKSLPWGRIERVDVHRGSHTPTVKTSDGGGPK